MRDGVNLSSQQRTQPVITATDIMSLNQLEAYVLSSGNFPTTHVKFVLPTGVSKKTGGGLRWMALNNTVRKDQEKHETDTMEEAQLSHLFLARAEWFNDLCSQNLDKLRKEEKSFA